MRIPSTDAVELTVHDLGGDGPPLLLCHATGFHGLVWRPVAERLRPHARLWAVDFRGHGDSSPPTGRGFEWDGFADDVLAVVDGLGVEAVFGVGHSKGGAALLLAEQRRPGTFRALYAYEPVVFPPGPVLAGPRDGADADGENPLAAGARRRREVFESYEAAHANFAGKPPFDALAEPALRAYVEHGFEELSDGSVRLKCRGAWEGEVYEMGSRHGAWERLGEVACPVTVARGAVATGGPAAIADLVVGRLPAGRLEVFDHLGHFGPLEDPAAVADAVIRAIQETGQEP